MIIPFTHENLEARRWPVVTVALIVVNVVCLIVLNAAMSARETTALAAVERAVAFHRAHPYLHACDSLAKVEGDAFDDDDEAPAAAPPPSRTAPSARPRPGARLLPSKEDRAEEQAQFDALCKDFDAQIADLPTRRYGYAPKDNNLLGLLTYQFLHGGWIHLLSNAWFLWLCGCNLEDRWGRAVFLPFYLTAGIAAALGQKLATPDSIVPVIGASGAIAGAMGAFLVVFARTRIAFAYLWFLGFRFKYGTFTAPAAVMLPLWLGTEIFWGMVGDRGVAHWVHVGGFVYGAAFAGVLHLSGLDRKLDTAIEASVTKKQDARILTAGDLIDAGKHAEAIALLTQVAAAQPRNIDAQLELLRAAKGAKDRARERDAYARLVELYFEMKAPDAAADMFLEMATLGMQQTLMRSWVLRVAENLTKRSLFARADEAYATACAEGIVDVVAVRATLAHGKVAMQLGLRDRARALFLAARESPFSTAELDGLIDAELAKLSAR